MSYLDFEQPILELEGKIAELRRMDDPQLDLRDELKRLEDKVERLLRQTYTRLTPWQKVQVARHPARPRFIKVATALFPDFTPLAGDRCFGEDAAIIGGLASFEGYTVMVLGQERGHDLQSRLQHNFGMAKPEGYRKAQRLMQMAERFGFPVLTFVDTPGAYPGVGAEERGQAEAIARCIDISLGLTVPVVTTILGEGGSGGAIALACADRLIMLEHAVYSVISPEGCASILWRSADHAAEAAEALRLTAQDLEKLGVIDCILPEPLGGAHRQPEAIIQSLRHTLVDQLSLTLKHAPRERRHLRQEKFLNMGRTTTTSSVGKAAAMI
ncbi:MAG: acetyl-CoA carboxylase carboxyltransferase subunit alpha [Holosporales bacterium]|jgi:acetyl-CoA carboxylase carboxyl transferase subunit alpha